MTKITRILILFSLFLNTSFATELKVINWNLYLLPKIAKGTSQDQRVDLIAEYLLNSEEDFDVITLQEVFTSYGFETLTEKLKAKYPYHTGKPARKWYKPVNSGLLILSKYPIREQSFYMYSSMAHADKFSSKGVLAITIEIEENSFAHIATTHLQAQNGEKYEQIRKRQYKYIDEKVIRNFKLKDIPLILTGDFNIDMHNENEYLPFMQYMGFSKSIFNSEEQFSVNSETNNLVEVSGDYKVVQEVLDYTFLFSVESLSKIIDNRILNPKGDYSLKGEEIKAGSLSDHFPIITTIEL